uniref:NADH:ubiquinone reductase (H(+)-translocating) n=1 Tax=Asplanchna sp. TaxID=3231738 RepID=A0AB39A6E5_9BILA
MAFTPFTMTFFSVYLLMLFTLFSLSDFYMFWLFMELCTLLFMGMSYTLFINSFSQLMFFFLVQTIASFNLLVFYIMSFHLLFLGSLFLKVAMFPFMHWYVNVVYRFPNFVLVFVSTLHKLPSMLLFMRFSSFWSPLVILSICLTMLFGAILMHSVIDLRYLVIVSTVISTSWFMLSLLSSGIGLFLIFYTVYSATLLAFFMFLGPLSKYLLSLSSYSTPARNSMFMLLINMAGLPPMPLFVLKLVILFNMAFESSMWMFYETLVILLLNVFVMVAYFKCFIKFFIFKYTSVSSILL